jgi:signal transduction histidine kinase
VRWLLLGVNGLVLLVPLAAVLGLRIYHNHLIRQTETGLIGQAVVIGEVWRELFQRERGQPPGDFDRIRPPGTAEDLFWPVEPVIDPGDEVRQPLAGPSRQATARDPAALRAGRGIEALLERAKAFNLSSARVLDTAGCTLASSGAWADGCFEGYAEIDRALAGRYAAVTRERHSDEPSPALSSISRRGDVRVFVALPVFDRGRVIAVVWMSRTSMDPLKAAWLNRRPFTAALALTVVVAVLASLFLSWTITRPLRRITVTAAAVAAGDGLPAPRGGFAPAEVHELEDALRTMASQLSERARYVAEYAANVTHELKSPITAIRGAAELLLEEGDEMDARQRLRFLRNIEADAGRMERLVSRLLELARIESTCEAVREIGTVSFLDQILEGYGGRVSLKDEGAPGSVVMNGDHLESAVRNLLDNAVRHGGDAPVILEARSAAGRLAITVRDRGPGIAEANRGRIFERFFTTERDRGGTGLGLAIVREVAKTRGGAVTFEAGEAGTAFTLVV